MVVRKGKTGEQTEAIQLLEYQIRVEGGLIHCGYRSQKHTEWREG